MKKLLKTIIVFCLSGAFLISPARVLCEEKTPSVEKIFYLAKYNAEAGVESVNKNWKQIDILAPQYHVVNADFSVSGGFGPKLKKAIKDHKLKVMPLLANANFSQSVMHNLLSSPAAQDKVIDYIIKGALTNGYIGWQFDFENISYLDRDLYSAFVEKAAEKFKKNNLLLSVAVIARWSDYEDTPAFKNWGGVYDYARLANAADFISLMAYDDPQSKGPVASVDYVNKILAYVKDKIPGQKLSLGVPFYYWKWNADSGVKIGSGLFKNLINIMASVRYVVAFDEGLGVSCLSYIYNNKNYKVWFEDKQSFNVKLNIVKDNNLRGFSAWLLGGEDPEIWKAL